MINRTAVNPRWAGFAVAALAVAVLYVLRWSGFNGGHWIDLDVYVRGGQSILSQAPLNPPHQSVLPFTYSPFAAVAFTPLHFLGLTAARWLFTLGSLVCYLVVVGVCGRRLRLPWSQVALVAVAGMALEPFMRTILLGQVNFYLMALVVLDCLVVRSSRRGWLVGLAAGIKIVPGVFVLYFMLRRDWGSTLRAAGGLLLTVICGAIAAPQDSLRFWTGGLFGISHFGPASVVDGKNQSFIGELIRLSGDPLPLVMTTVVLCAAGVALGIAAARRQLRTGDDVAALTAIAIGGLLASPLSWTHHWVWAVPAVLVLVSRRQWLGAWLLGLVFAIGSARGLTLLPSQESLTLLQQVACGTYVAAGVGLLAIWAFGSDPVTVRPDSRSGRRPGWSAPSWPGSSHSRERHQHTGSTRAPSRRR